MGRLTVCTAAAALYSLIAVSGGAKAEDARDPIAYGRELFEAWCSRCHGSAKNDSPFAPPLNGLFGRKSASVEGFPYSRQITSLELVWDAEALKAWLAGLATESPTTSVLHLGVQQEREREALAAYIATLK